jgi:hypothetical protein
MPLPYQQNKKYVYAWRMDNVDRLREIITEKVFQKLVLGNQFKLYF